MKVFMNCEEANHTCDKTQYKEASFWEKIKLNIHLIYCFACRKYTARNTKLTKAVEKSKPKTLGKEQKEKMEEALQREISK
jgi:SPX domain protein involved in polyphosphate accumulation